MVVSLYVALQLAGDLSSVTLPSPFDKWEKLQQTPNTLSNGNSALVTEIAGVNQRVTCH